MNVWDLVFDSLPIIPEQNWMSSSVAVLPVKWYTNEFLFLKSRAFFSRKSFLFLKYSKALGFFVSSVLIGVLVPVSAVPSLTLGSALPGVKGPL